MNDRWTTRTAASLSRQYGIEEMHRDPGPEMRLGAYGQLELLSVRERLMYPTITKIPPSMIKAIPG